MRRHVGGFRPDPTRSPTSSDQLDLDERRPDGGAAAAFGDPEVLLGACDPRPSRAWHPLLDAAVAVVGYIDWVVDAVAVRVIGGEALRIAEAVRRRRVETTAGRRVRRAPARHPARRGPGGRGKAFARASSTAPASTVSDPAGPPPTASMPHPAEVDAPGLWLARVSRRLTAESPGGGPLVPRGSERRLSVAGSGGDACGVLTSYVTWRTAPPCEEAERGIGSSTGSVAATTPTELEPRLERANACPWFASERALHDASNASFARRRDEVQHGGEGDRRELAADERGDDPARPRATGRRRACAPRDVRRSRGTTVSRAAFRSPRTPRPRPAWPRPRSRRTPGGREEAHEQRARTIADAARQIGDDRHPRPASAGASADFAGEPAAATSAATNEQRARTASPGAERCTAGSPPAPPPRAGEPGDQAELGVGLDELGVVRTTVGTSADFDTVYVFCRTNATKTSGNSGEAVEDDDHQQQHDGGGGRRPAR